MAHLRGPLGPLRIVIGFVTATMICGVSGLALMNQWAFETWRAENTGGGPRRAHASPAPTPPDPAVVYHDPNAYYPSGEPTSNGDGALLFWTIATVGGLGVAIVAGGVGVASLLRGSPAEEGPAA
jgi:hypothetical protein